MNDWFVYMVECADGTLYTGITTNLERRMEEHNHGGKLAARYTRSRTPVQLVYSEVHPDRATASKREAVLKRLPRAHKLRLIRTQEVAG